MKNNFIIFIILLQYLILSSCNENKDKNKSLPVVDIEANINNMKIINLSQFTDDIRYIPLENVENPPLFGISEIDVSGDLILISDRHNCLLYDLHGNFIAKIGNRGKGPKEYQFITNIGLETGKNRKIFIQSMHDLLEYNIDGSFVKKYSKSLFLNENHSLEVWHLLNDSLIFGYIPNTTGRIEYKAMIINKQGVIKKKIKNYDVFKSEHAAHNFITDFAHIYKFNGSLWFKEYVNDTLYVMDKYYELFPKYVFNLGKLKISNSDRLKFPIADILWSHKTPFEIFQTEDYLLLKFLFGNQFPAKRLTPKPSPFPGQDVIWLNTNYILGIYSKHSKELVLCKPSNTDNPLFTSGLYNDIDCGPRFFPTGMVNDSTLFMWVKADELKNHVASDDFKNSVPKYPEKKKELEKLADSLSVFDNPVLMFVTFKGK